MSIGSPEILLEPEAGAPRRRARRRGGRGAVAAAAVLAAVPRRPGLDGFGDLHRGADPGRDLRAAGRQHPRRSPDRMSRTRTRSTRSEPDGARARPSVRRRPARPRRALAHHLRRARVAEVGIIGTAIATVIGTVIGLVAGFYRRWVDTALIAHGRRLPRLPGDRARASASPPRAAFAGASAALIQPGLATVIFVIALVSFTYIARIVRGQVLSLREKEFVEASRSLGASNRRIIVREVLPNLLAPMIVYASLLIPANILLEAALSFLGVGVRPPTASWGQMLSTRARSSTPPGGTCCSPGCTAAYRARIQPGRRRSAGRAQPEGRPMNFGAPVGEIGSARNTRGGNCMRISRRRLITHCDHRAAGSRRRRLRPQQLEQPQGGAGASAIAADGGQRRTCRSSRARTRSASSLLRKEGRDAHRVLERGLRAP